jgi:uncharacterized membrane protein YfcA
LDRICGKDVGAMIGAEQGVLAVLSGVVVGLFLGLFGGGGSILATPLLLYVVGVADPHIAIGTSALAVAANALAGLAGHWRRGNVKWPCAAVFAVAGIVGAALGSSLGKIVSGPWLLILFALIMVAVGIAMLRPRAAEGDAGVRLTLAMAPRLGAVGFVTGALAGFFGIGGGFLIVPGIMLGSGMPLINAIGSSLFSVAAFGLTTAVNYAFSHLVDWSIAALFIAGGVIGSVIGIRLVGRLAARRAILAKAFAGVIFVVAAYTFIRSVAALG